MEMHYSKQIVVLHSPIGIKLAGEMFTYHQW